MNVAQAMAAILKDAGVDLLFCYPTNKIIDEAARIGIRPVVVRQERTGIHMADAWSRLNSGQKFGVFAMQHGPGAENSFGGIAQAYAESVPILIIAQGYPQRIAGVDPNFNSVTSMRAITKHAEALSMPSELTNVMRRAFSQLTNGRGGPVLVEVPQDMWTAEVDHPATPLLGKATEYMPSHAAVLDAVDLITQSASPVLVAGQGVHYARAWKQLRELAETLGAPVATTLPGKSAFPESHRLSLGSGGLTYPKTVKDFLSRADLIIGIGCSFTETIFGVEIPLGPKIVHLTIDPDHLNKDIKADVGLVGDAKLSLGAILSELRDRRHPTPPHEDIAAEIEAIRTAWLAEWMPKLRSDSVPLSPYRVIWDLMQVVSGEETVITHDAGRPRDQLTPFWVADEPLSFIGWGKTTQLGYGLGIAMGAKLARPDHLCINIWGDAAIGFTGTDLETAVRERIPVLSILLNNGGMATELGNIPAAIERYRAADISGNYAEFASALGAYSERIESPEMIVPAIRRGIAKTKQGVPVLLEFMTQQETAMSKP